MAVDQWPRGTPAVQVLGQPVEQQPAVTGPIDVLLLGNDNRLRWADPEQRHADTVMLIHVPADRSRTYLISLPRDGEVKLPDGSQARLTETLLRGGPALAERTVAELTGVDFDARVTLDLRALRAVTAAVGGVEMCLPQPIKLTPTGRKFPKGCQHIDADEITSVLQSRYGLRNGSYDRDRTTQRFLAALAAKLTADGTLTDPARMQALLRAGRDGIELDGGPGALLAAVASLESAEVVGVSEPSFRATPEGRERIYPGVGPGLYAAIRGDTLQTWTRANPLYVTK